MPYLPLEARAGLTPPRAPRTAGELNYAISRLCWQYVRDFSEVLSYSDLNEVVGVLECAKQEFYRRLAAPYEDRMRDVNGDIL